MKSYAISFNPLTIATLNLLSYLDTRQEIKNWYTPFPGTVMVATHENPRSVALLIGQQFPAQPFFVSETNYTNIDGQLPNIAWDFISHPKSSGRWDGPIGALSSSNSSSTLARSLFGLTSVNK